MNSILNVQEAASCLRISPQTLYGWAGRRKITHIKLGRRLVFDKEDIQRFIDSSRVEAVNPKTRAKEIIGSSRKACYNRHGSGHTSKFRPEKEV